MSYVWHMLTGLSIWVKIGFLGQAAFTARFLVQWVASEKKKDSIVPVAFWWLSLLGGTILLAYAIHRQDPVIIVGQAMGLVVYVRNLMLVERARRRAAKRLRRTQSESVATSKPHRVDASAKRVPWA
jgi:lipid-A-disaccharide synthase-like uncharacterized protein